MDSPADCPNCGTQNFKSPGPCTVCDFSTMPKLLLVTESGAHISLGTTAQKLNDAWAKTKLGEDGLYWSKDWQMCIEPMEPDWIVTPNIAAKNETLINGAAITSPCSLENGMVIGVGREAKGIVKTPLTVLME